MERTEESKCSRLVTLKGDSILELLADAYPIVRAAANEGWKVLDLSAYEQKDFEQPSKDPTNVLYITMERAS